MPQTPITLDPEREPWDRQPEESAKKHHQFLAYRDIGLTRTLTEAAEKLTLAYGHVRNIASRYLWQERVDAWDARQARVYAARLEEERRRAAESDAKILRVMTGMVGQALPHLDASKMTWAEFTRFVDTTMRLRRQLFGDPTDTIAVTGQGGDPLRVELDAFAGLPAEQRRARLGELAASVMRRAQALDGSDDDDVSGGPPTGGA
jgi:hypothetical protein